MKRLLICVLVLAVGAPAVAFGAGEGRSLITGKRNPTGGELTRETQIISRNGSYSTRQSNLGAGGGAIYGCRADAGNEEPCVRANNLSTGRAFEFETGGKEGGEILVKDASGVPFVTNATGKVANPTRTSSTTGRPRTSRRSPRCCSRRSPTAARWAPTAASPPRRAPTPPRRR